MDKIRTHLKRGEREKASAEQMVASLLRLLRFDPAMYAVFEIWDRETRGLVRNAEAVALNGSTLCVKVPSVVHRQELLYSKERVISRMNQALGKRVVTDIQFELETL
jgi:Dna[CI] antecedent, DciA